MLFTPIDFNIGTSVNNNPNYNVGMTVDPGLMESAWDVYSRLSSPGSGYSSGGSGGYSSGGSGGYSSGGSGGTEVGAMTQQVNPNQLMSEQMELLLASDSPYLNRARTEGARIASRRGLANSSIMSGASMGAAIDRAAPIAQFDASRFGSVADQNMSAENQMRIANMNRAASSASASMSASAARYAADAARQSQLDQMLLGYHLGSLDDYRRQALGIETREDDQAFRGGQADIDRFLAERQFWENTAPLAWSQFGHGQNIDWANVGLQRGQLDLGRDELGLRRDQFVASDTLNNRQLDALIYNQQVNPFLSTINSIYGNPNLDATQMNAAATNMINMYPGIVNQAWLTIPPGLVNDRAIQSAQALPRMPMIRRSGG